MSQLLNGNTDWFKEAKDSELLFCLIFLVFINSSIWQVLQHKVDIDKKDNF